MQPLSLKPVVSANKKMSVQLSKRLSKSEAKGQAEQY
jgi:hypothetical protein